jgi:MFS family permease
MPGFAISPKSIALVGGVANSVVAGLVFPYVTVYLNRQAGYSITEAGSVVGLATAANIVVRMLAGGVIDRLNVRKAAWIGLVLAAVLPLLLVCGPTWFAVFTGLVAYTLGGIFFDSAITLLIYVDGATDVEKKINYSYYYAAHNAFLAIAPTVTFIVAPSDYRDLFVAALLLQSALVLGTAWFAFSKRLAEIKRPMRPRGLRSYASLLNAGFVITFSLSACYSLVYRQYFTNIANLLEHAKLLGRDVYPLVVAINGSFVIFLQPIYARFLKRSRRVDFLVAGAACLLAGLSLLALPLPIVTTIIPFAFLFTLAEVFLNLNMVDNLMTFAPADSRATWLNCFALSRLSSTIGIPAGAFLLDRLGRSAFVSSMMTVALVMCLLAAANMKLRQVRLANPSSLEPRPTP